MTTAGSTIGDFAAALAAKQPVPGGGAAAAVAAALGCATGAMACRYTAGPRYTAAEPEALALAERLDGARLRALALADADADAYAAVRTAKAGKDPQAIARAEHAAAAVPADLITLCASAADACRAFRPRCNPWLVSDIDTALALLAGAARAALATLRINNPPPSILAEAETRVSGMA